MLNLRPKHDLFIALAALAAPAIAWCDPPLSIQKVCSDPAVVAFVAEADSQCFVRRVNGSKLEKAHHHPILHESLAMGEIVECFQAGATLLITNCDGREDKRLTPADMRDRGYLVPSVSPHEPDDDDATKRAARLALNLPKEEPFEGPQETFAAEATASNPHALSTDRGVTILLADGRPHVFIVGNDLDVVDSSGRECALTSGDVIQLSGPPAPDVINISATVLASKGGRECASSAEIAVALQDLLDMHDHMRATIDRSLAELPTKQGRGVLPRSHAAAGAAPTNRGFASGAPPPDANAATEISTQARVADRAEAASAGAPEIASSRPATISKGQSLDQVIATFGQPVRIVDLGTKKIYAYPEMKITFMNGKVSDVQ